MVAAVAWHAARVLGEPAGNRLGSWIGIVGAAGATVVLVVRGDLFDGLVAGWAWTLGVGLAAAGVAVAARSSRRVGAVVGDRRMRDLSTGSFAVHVGVRIPVLTAYAEEVVHRGLVWLVVADTWSDMVALWVTSVAFGLGHVAVARQQALGEGRGVLGWVVLTVAATTVAGLLLGWLRLTTGGIWAGVGVHAVANMVLAVGARWARVPRNEAP